MWLSASWMHLCSCSKFTLDDEYRWGKFFLKKKFLKNIVKFWCHYQKTAWIWDNLIYFDVLYSNLNWFSGVIWVICPLFWSTPVPSKLISKVRTEGRGNLGDFCKENEIPKPSLYLFVPSESNRIIA